MPRSKLAPRYYFKQRTGGSEQPEARIYNLSLATLRGGCRPKVPFQSADWERNVLHLITTGVQTMKNKKAIIHLIEVAYACLILLGPALIFAGEKSGGHVIVNRVANFGTDLSLSVSVDGSEVANLVEGRNYDGYLPPGKHVISAVVSPNREDSHPGNVTINVKVGETYSFTAVWQGEDLALVNNE